MSGFSNPVSNAAGTLVRAVLKSVNFVAGLVGWQISRDGDAEFNNVSVRGTVFGDLQSTSPVPSDAIITSSVTGDAFSRLQILADGSLHWGDGTHSQDTFLVRTGPSVLMVADSLTTQQVDLIAPNPASDLIMTGAMSGDAISEFQMFANGEMHMGDGTNPQQIQIVPDAANGRLGFNVPDGVLVNSFDIGQGMQQYTALNATTSLSTTEAAITTLPSVTFKKGRVYELRVTAGITIPSGGIVLLKVRKGTGTAGAQWTQSGNLGPITGQLTRRVIQRMANYSGADITTAYTLIGVTNTGTGSVSVPDDNPTTASRRIRVELWDVGSTGEFTNEPAIS